VLELGAAGRPDVDVARDLGINVQSTYVWRRRDRIDKGLEPGLNSAEKAELSVATRLMTRRIERAMALLRRGDLSVTDVCFAVGCASLGTFSTRFTELVGMPPSTYRDQATRATAGMPSCVAKQVTRPIRNREAPVTEPDLA
jgi:hypothetical protein